VPQESKLTLIARVGRVFTPGTPVSRISIFGGRLEQIMEIVGAVTAEGQHAVLFGDRGVGKTSLANVLTEIFAGVEDGVNLRYVRVNCNTGDSFTILWSNILREMGVERDDEDAHRLLTPEDVRFILAKQPSTVIVIDELDRLENDDALTSLADTVKSLSDHAVDTTLVLVGVADSVDELIGDHHSIERALVQVPMPRMPQSELAEIVDKGTGQLEMTITASAKERITRLSEGLPHYTHLLAMNACLRALTDDRSEVNDTDVDGAIKAAVDKAQHSIRSSYTSAIRSAHKDALFEQVLLACALAEKDELGCFAAGAVRGPMNRIMRKRYDIPAFARHLTEFTTFERGAVLTRSGRSRNQFYRFRNPMLPPYVILNGLANGVIGETDLQDQPVSAFGPREPTLPFTDDEP
jgi:hypothetical protein